MIDQEKGKNLKSRILHPFIALSMARFVAKFLEPSTKRKRNLEYTFRKAINGKEERIEVQFAANPDTFM